MAEEVLIMYIVLTYINKDLRVVTREVHQDGSVTEEEPLICAGDSYGTIDDPYLVDIGLSTDFEGVFKHVAQGRDPDGALAYLYVERDLLGDDLSDFYESIAEIEEANK